MSKRTLRYVFLVLAFIGTIGPYAAFLPFIADHGFDINRIVTEAGANRIAAFAWLDVLVSAVALLVAAQSRQFITIKQSLLVSLFTVAVGVSAGLPLFLYFLSAPSGKNAIAISAAPKK